MRTPIPQELINAIIHGVEDMESLKCCSLVSTRFRGASQRILLRSLTLYHTWNHGTVACTLLTESPHTASYIKNITLNLPSWLPNGHAAAGRLRAAFDKLTYVRQVAIDGNNVSWDVVSPLASTIFDFIRNRDLKELHVQRVQNLPWPALATLISSAPVVSMDEVLPLEEVDVVMPQNGDLPVSNLRRLLASYSDAACDVLARPEFAFCLPKLRELGLDHTPVNSSLLSAASARLDSVYFDLAHHISTAFLPPLPGLRTIHMALHWCSDANSQCMSDAIASILVSGPATLQDIIFTYKVFRDAPEFAPPYLQPAALAAVLSLDGCKPPPCVRWRLDFGFDGEVGAARQEERLAEFTAYMERELGALHGKGRLIVEPHDPGEWMIPRARR